MPRISVLAPLISPPHFLRENPLWEQPRLLLAGSPRREPPVYQGRHEDDRPLEALGLVDSEDVCCQGSEAIAASPCGPPEGGNAFHTAQGDCPPAEHVPVLQRRA